jgi:deazaflavin-dependent oxidoreductase (nitroreductase family)
MGFMDGPKPKKNIVWTVMRRINPRVVENYRTGKSGARILLLTTTGRKSGLQRMTPLQYLEKDGIIFVAAAKGESADWYRNLAVNPQVEVDLGGEHFLGLAAVEKDSQQVIAYVRSRLAQHPLMMRLVMVMDGAPIRMSDADLEAYAQKLALVIIRRRPSATE